MASMNGDVVRGLREGRRAILEQIAKLNGALESLDRLVELFSEDAQIELTDIVEGAQRKQGTTQYVRSLFNSQPTKRWRANAIVESIRSGLVKTNAKNMEANVASILRRLIKQKEIDRGGSRAKRWYRKKQEVLAE